MILYTIRIHVYLIRIALILCMDAIQRHCVILDYSRHSEWDREYVLVCGKYIQIIDG